MQKFEVSTTNLYGAKRKSFMYHLLFFLLNFSLFFWKNTDYATDICKGCRKWKNNLVYYLFNNGNKWCQKLYLSNNIPFLTLLVRVCSVNGKAFVLPSDP